MKPFFLCVVFALLCATPLCAISVGDTAPDFPFGKTWNTDATSLGNMLSHQKVVIVEVFATWCPHCYPAAKHLSQLHTKYSAQGLEIISVAGDAKESTFEVEGFISQNGMVQPVTFYPGIMGMYGFRGFPSAAVVAPNGKVVYVNHPGTITDQMIQGWLKDYGAGAAFPGGGTAGVAPGADNSNPGMAIVYAMVGIGVLLGLVAGGLFLKGKLGGGGASSPVIASTYPMLNAPPQAPPAPQYGQPQQYGAPPQQYPAGSPYGAPPTASGAYGNAQPVPTGYGAPGQTRFRTPSGAVPLNAPQPAPYLGQQQPPVYGQPQAPAYGQTPVVAPQGGYIAQPQGPYMAQQAVPPVPPPASYAIPSGIGRPTQQVPRPAPGTVQRTATAQYPKPPAYQPTSAPASPPPAPAPAPLVVDAQGYVVCPACMVRTRANRASCMNCGTALPPIGG